MVFSVLGVLTPEAHRVFRSAGQARIESQLTFGNAIARWSCLGLASQRTDFEPVGSQPDPSRWLLLLADYRCMERAV